MTSVPVWGTPPLVQRNGVALRGPEKVGDTLSIDQLVMVGSKDDGACPGSGDDGLGGADNAFGGGGDDVHRMGPGDDVANGNDGNDVLFGAQGVDALWGGRDQDRLFGGWGPDALQADVGSTRADPASDHLIDWVGNHNLFYVCKKGEWGTGKIIRSPSPNVRTLLTELAIASGATDVDTAGSGGGGRVRGRRSGRGSAVPSGPCAAHWRTSGGAPSPGRPGPRPARPCRCRAARSG